MFGWIVGAAVVSNSSGQKDVWAKRDRDARIRKNMPRVEAAIAGNRQSRVQQDEVAARNRRLARELVGMQAEIDSLKYQLALIENAKNAFPTAVIQFS